MITSPKNFIEQFQNFIEHIAGVMKKFVKTVNSIEPDAQGNIKLDLVKSVNSTTADESGNITLDVGVKTVNNNLPDKSGNININSFDGNYDNLTNKPKLNFLPLTGGTVTGTIKAISFQSTSDVRLKINLTIQSYDLSSLNVYRYQFINKDDRYYVGLLAQEVEKIIPEAVLTDTVTGYKSIDYNAVTAALVSTVNQLTFEVNELKSKIYGVN